MDRAQLRTVAGGEFAGDLADGVVKPNLPADYAPSGMWTGLLGQKVPDTGDPEAAKQLIADSGEPMPTLQYDYPQTPVNDKQAARSSARWQGRHQGAAEPDRGRAVLRHRARPGQGGPPGRCASWGPDWSNASTVIPELFTPTGGFNLSQADDKAFNEKSAQAKALDRPARRRPTLWKELNKEAMEKVWVVPTRFGRDQRLAGSKVGLGVGQGRQCLPVGAVRLVAVRRPVRPAVEERARRRPSFWPDGRAGEGQGSATPAPPRSPGPGRAPAGGRAARRRRVGDQFLRTSRSPSSASAGRRRRRRRGLASIRCTWRSAAAEARTTSLAAAVVRSRCDRPSCGFGTRSTSPAATSSLTRLRKVVDGTPITACRSDGVTGWYRCSTVSVPLWNGATPRFSSSWSNSWLIQALVMAMFSANGSGATRRGMADVTG